MVGFGLAKQADVAQLVEQPIRNRQVISSSLIVGSILSITYSHFHCTLISL
jgi:hypothetical protein